VVLIIKVDGFEVQPLGKKDERRNEREIEKTLKLTKH
jgi:hypothetical protein